MSNKIKMSEQELINDMTQILKGKMEKDYEKGDTKRDAHPKALGVMKAKFQVLDNLPEQARVGIFSEPKMYKSLIRFSNASAKVQSDKKKDFRGIGIKLLGVEGERTNELEKQTQDFLLMTYPTMPLGTVQLFHDAVYYAIVKSPLRLVWHFMTTGNASILKELSKGKKFDTSPLDIMYWSTTPYRYGDKFVKYKMIPTSSYKSQLPKTLTDNYLRENMKKHMKVTDATFDFYIQFYKDEDVTPLEDAGVEWKEVDAPFIKVAKITIPIQKFDTELRDDLGEELSFSPDNTLKVHEGVGGINRARREIYAELSKFRHERDERKHYEPTTYDYDFIM